MEADVGKLPVGVGAALLEARELYRFYHIGDDETVALRGVSLHLDAGMLLALIGPSGSGKSTLLACLAGLDEPDGGHVLLRGQRITRRPESVKARLRAEEIGILLQSGNLFEHLSVEDNILLSMQLARRIDRQRLDELLDLTLLRDRRTALPDQLSGGEAARAGLAAALAAAPALLLADEPTGEVDAATEDLLLDLIGDYCRLGGAALIATHSAALTRRASGVLRLRDGGRADE